MAEEGTKPGISEADVNTLIATHAALFGLHTKIIRKTATESIISSTTFTNDAELKFSVLANEVWYFWLRLRANRQSGGTQDSKFGWTIPAGSSLGRSWILASVTTELDATGALTLTQIAAPAVKYDQLVYLFIGGSEPGTVQLQWTQYNGEEYYHYFLLNSFIIAHRLA